MIAWVNRTASRWRDLVASHPEALRFPCDIRETEDVGGLLQHIVAVELRYAERLADLPETTYDAIPHDSVEAIYAVHQRAMHLVVSLEDKDAGWWQRPIEFATRSAGSMSASRQIVLFHLLMHSIRHYAQLATIVRRHGISPGWMMDYLDMRDAEQTST